MKIINADAILMFDPNGYEALKRIEAVARTCYKSENLISDGSAEKMVKNLIRNGHEAMLEHYSFTAKFICDRGVSHEIVRHRIASYAQESTRYCNYSKDKFGNELTFIKPCFWDENSDQYRDWKSAMHMAESHYFDLLQQGATPQEARSVLPNSLKTELIMTANIREWRNFFKLRTDKAAHPQMREVATILLNKCHKTFPILFDDIIVNP